MNRPIALLVVLDGWGDREEIRGNAVRGARLPALNRLAAVYPEVLLNASGEEVGLPPGLMGNSEVGHLNLGAGRVVDQDILRIDKVIKDGSFFKNPAFQQVAELARKRDGAIHFLGLLSDGGVHSALPHLFALVRWAKEQEFRRVFLHAFLDGRDTPPKSARKYLDAVKRVLADLGVGRIATISGRYWGMDRDKRWDRTERAYRALVHGQGFLVTTAEEALMKGYMRGETDEFITPTVIAPQGDGIIQDGDGVIFYNFRADRARQLTRALAEPGFDGFSRGEGPPKIAMATMTEYDATFKVPVAFPPVYLANTLGEWIALQGWKQLRLAETEKYAHVTYFFNGGREDPFPGEERVLIPSPKVATYDLVPAMSALEITGEAERRIRSGEYRFMVLNYANPDMVGHTGVYDATVVAMEVVDGCVGRLVGLVEELGGMMVLTADHGNAEQMVDPETGQPHTAHTTNPVPCYFIGKGLERLSLRPAGVLADVAPTFLEILGIPKPSELTGSSLHTQEVKSGKKAKIPGKLYGGA